MLHGLLCVLVKLFWNPLGELEHAYLVHLEVTLKRLLELFQEHSASCCLEKQQAWPQHPPSPLLQDALADLF